MTELETVWRSKTDAQLADAAAQIQDYGSEAQLVIRAELGRRGLEEHAIEDGQHASQQNGVFTQSVSGAIAQNVAAKIDYVRRTDLPRRVFFTLIVLGLVRLGWQITIPGVDRYVVQALQDSSFSLTLWSWKAFSVGNFQALSVFALGIYPYVIAFVLLQAGTMIFRVLTSVVPYLRGNLKVIEIPQKYTMYLAVVLAAFQSLGIAMGLEHGDGVALSPGVHPGLQFELMTMTTLTLGSVVMVLAGHAITKHGIGNGIVTLMVVGTALLLVGASGYL